MKLKRRWRLFPKYATLIIALVGGTLIASGAVGLYFSYQESQDHLAALQTEKAQGAANRIEQYVLEIQQQLSWTALPRMEAKGEPLEARRIEYLKLLRQAPAVTEVTWLDPEGKEQLRVSRLAMDALSGGADQSREASFRDAKAGKIHYGAVYFRKGTEPYMTISRPAGSGGGVTVAEVNLKFVWDVVSRIKIGQAGLAYVIDSGGTLIAHPDISLVLKKTEMKALPQVAALDRPDAPLLGRNLRGEEVFSAHAVIPTLHWTVFVESPRAEVLAPLYATIVRMGLVLAAGLLLSAIASFFLARALVRPLRALQAGAARIGQGELDQRIQVHTGDELEGLAEQFNKMGLDLQASYAGLERKVEERTRELTFALEQQRASAEVLNVISNSVADTAPVFDAITASCARIFEGVTVGISLVDANGTLTLAAYRGPGREALEELYPIPLSMASGSGAAILQREVLHFPDLDKTQDLPEYVIRGGRANNVKSLVFAPMLWEGQGIGAIYIGRAVARAFTDKEISLLRTFADQGVIAIQNARLFNEIRYKSMQLEKANKHKSEFLANMSHELRTPLNAVIGFSEVLSEQMFGKVNEKQMEYLQDIHSSGRHLLSLINDILDLSKIEAGRMELDLATFNLALLLDNCTILVRERASRHGLALRMEVEEGLTDWVADERKVKQVVVNLLSNAVKFTPAGGSVTLRARRVPLADGDSSDVEISVIDTGVGIAQDQQALVFEEFRQAGGDYLRKSEGTGLGLSLAKSFVELHGGSIRVESAPGEGSTFSFVLPERVLEAV